MKKSQITAVLGTILLTTLASISQAQTLPTHTPKTIKSTSTLKINIEVAKRAPDEKGTDVTNIYNFTLTDASGVTNTASYVLVMSIDGEEKEQINSITFPYFIERNFKGLEAGTHQITMNIEEVGTFDLLAQESVTINVVK